MGGKSTKRKHMQEIERVLEEEDQKRREAVKEKEDQLNAERERAVMEIERRLTAERELAVKEKERQLNAEQKRKEDEEKKKSEAQLLKVPWRKTNIEFGEEQCTNLARKIGEFQINPMNIKGGQRKTGSKEEMINTNIIANILLLGPVGAGKSSFINSVYSISPQRFVHKAYTAGFNHGSLTSMLSTFREDDTMNNFRLLDTFGLMEKDDRGFNMGDLIPLIDGRISGGYKFKPNEPINEKDPHYRQQRTIEHMMHCVVFVVEASNMDTITDEYIRKIRSLQEMLIKAGVPRVFILTKCDHMLSDVQGDVANIFRSKRIEDAVNMASKTFSCPQIYVHPIVNYGEGSIDTDPITNIPILLAVRQMVHFASDYIAYQASKEAMNEVPQEMM